MRTSDVREEGVGSIQTTTGGGGSKIGKILWTSFTDGPQSIISNYGIWRVTIPKWNVHNNENYYRTNSSWRWGDLKRVPRSGNLARNFFNSSWYDIIINSSQCIMYNVHCTYCILYMYSLFYLKVPGATKPGTQLRGGHG